MTSKERAKLKADAMNIGSTFQVGKMSLTPQQVDAIRTALKARELVKINILKNSGEDVAGIAKLLSERTGSEIVQVIGRKVVLYRKNPQIEEKKKLAAKRELKKKEYVKKKLKEKKQQEKKPLTRNKGNSIYKNTQGRKTGIKRIARSGKRG